MVSFEKEMLISTIIQFDIVLYISCYHKLEKKNPTNITFYDDVKEDASCGSSRID